MRIINIINESQKKGLRIKGLREKGLPEKRAPKKMALFTFRT